MEKFKGKYRIPSARRPNWDYSSEGAYFITICTEDRKRHFGEITNGKMILSPVGVIADILWYEIKNHATNVELYDFVVMPNHVHGILHLLGNDCCVDVETLHATSLPPQPIPKNEQMAKISPKSHSVSTIIRSYKAAVTKHARRLGFQMEWQPRFHDHVIRDKASHDRISNYILNNVRNWKEDRFLL